MKLSNDHIFSSTIDDSSITRLMNIISTGRVILFTGAGFSCGCKNILHKVPPLSKRLAEYICDLGNFEQDSDLTYVADYYLSYCDKSKLIDFLKEQFSIVETTESHNKVVSLPWKRIYTTNYDNSVERCAEKSRKIISSLTVYSNPKKYYKKKNTCIHINGTISSLSEDDLDVNFKLTRTSYLSSESFVSSPWYYYFKKDLEQASGIVFVGYSLYDVDIEKILFSSPTLNKKTYFVISKEPSQKEQYVLSKYGTVLPIGIDGFASLINERYKPINIDQNFWLDAFTKYELFYPDHAITDDEIMSFILYGSLRKRYIDDSFSIIQHKPYMIIRKCLETVEHLIETNRYIVLLSDLGNGKTIVLNQLMAYLTILGKQVFYLQNQDGDFASDIEKIHALDMESILIIDDYSLSFEIVQYISNFNSPKLKLIFSDRTHHHDRLRPILEREHIEYAELNLDILNEDEINFLISIIDNLGFWGEKAHYSNRRKINEIKTVNRAQISHVLLNLFDSPQIKNRINKLLSPILIDTEFKDTIFAICLVEILNLPTKPSLISELAGNDLIYKSYFINNNNIKQLFIIGNDRIISKSSIFSLSIINNFFSSVYITNRLLNLVQKYDRLRHYGTAEKELFKSFLRFSFVERLLPPKNKLNSLVKYYEELKIRVSWLKRDPHFWLQYGMARMNFGQLEKAQSNLDEAYVLAKNRENYDTSYLDTQQARLFILMSMEETDGNIIWAFFQKAHNLLIPIRDDIYKYRQVLAYKRFFDKKFVLLSKKNKQRFFQAARDMLNNIEHSDLFSPNYAFNDHTISSCHRYLSDIIKEIEEI